MTSRPGCWPCATVPLTPVSTMPDQRWTSPSPTRTDAVPSASLLLAVSTTFCTLA
jgi:hypothetical protein